MRDYGKIISTFWTGGTGRDLHGHPEAQIVALYLMTSPHSTMTGVYYCPQLYIEHETGLGPEGALKGLTRLCDIGFCTYDTERSFVFVHEMARYQIGESLAPNDNRVKSTAKEFAKMPPSDIKDAFHERYEAAFHLPLQPRKPKPLKSPSEVPSKGLLKPLRSQEHEQEHDQEQEQEQVDPIQGEGNLSVSTRPAGNA